MLPTRSSLALFCKVVDNYGDIGICWRLARQLTQEHHLAVSLWVDDLRSFQRLCPEVALEADVQQIAGVTIRQWRDQDGVFAVRDVADIVIEFFGCDIPPGYIAAMAQCRPRPLWFNLEGLSAEQWVEDCHTLPSPHPRLSLTKHFFFPGFTARTGGLLREAALDIERDAFQAGRSELAGFLGQFGVTPAEIVSTKVSLFCYPHAPVRALFDAWQAGAEPVTCLVPEGVAVETVEGFLGVRAAAGAVQTQGALTVRVLPFVAQRDYDKILWACDVNVVRGEDSFVRAQWAGKPFVWHIYPQDKNLHRVKLKAFLQAYAPDIDSVTAFSLHWNGAVADEANCATDWPAMWRALQDDRAAIALRATTWQQEMLANGDLAGNLMRFAAVLRSVPED
ncbi:elongation factor P maturation arginine rhamnosyltransferase EarP [Actimicrobium sp. GrIS 1.19]|uniref:elongation factor P maturation arginine rhamnosyltransferase EarP n=1 Tax=Actimicrobium sp. GrIS 1.19 TaxID=3071708 RepID=UPI002E14469D